MSKYSSRVIREAIKHALKDSEPMLFGPLASKVFQQNPSFRGAIGNSIILHLIETMVQEKDLMQQGKDFTSRYYLPSK